MELFGSVPESQSAVTTGTGRGIAVNHADRCTVFVKGSGTISGGEVVVEVADSPGYTGTWATYGTPITPVTDKVIPVFITDPVGAVRTRVTSDITGGGLVSTSIQAYKS